MVNKIGKNLRRIRKSRKITQEELAEILGITSQAVSVYERCLGNPSLEVLIKMCEVLECSPNTLLEY